MDVSSFRISARTVDGGVHDLPLSSRELVAELFGDDVNPPISAVDIEFRLESGERIEVAIPNEESVGAQVKCSPPEIVEFDTRSTSRDSADCTDVCLKETQTTRLVARLRVVSKGPFGERHPQLLLVHQRKAKSGEFQDLSAESLSKLKAGEGVRISLRSSETERLLSAIHAAKELSEDSQIFRGKHKWIRVPTGHLQGGDDADFKQLVRVVLDATQSQPANRLVELLERRSMIEFGWAMRVAELKSAISEMEDLLSSGAEEEWQKFLEENSSILEQVFSWPVSVIQNRAYVGGKSVSNSGGGYVDFLTQHTTFSSLGFIEIKTPQSQLMSKVPYRDGVYTPSSELTGAIQQSLNYRDTLISSQTKLNDGEMPSVVAPRCVVIAGQSNLEFRDRSEVRDSFQRFRGALHGVEVVTFDELIEQTKRIFRFLDSDIEEGPVH